MGGVGDKPAALLLRGLKPLGQFVELVAQNGQLVIAAHVYFVGVVALPDDAHGCHDPVQTPGEGVGKGRGEDHNDQFQQEGDAQNRALQRLDQPTLGGVVVGHVHAAHNGAVVVHRRGGPGVNGPVPVAPGADVISVQRREDFREKSVGTHGSGTAVVQGAARLVRHQQPGHLQAFNLPDHRGDGGGIHNLQGGNLVRGQQAFFNHAGLLALVEQVLAGDGAVDIQNQQHHKGDDHIGHGVAVLRLSIAADRGRVTS